MFRHIASSQMRRVSLTIALTLTLLWLLSGIVTSTNAVQAQPIDLTRPLSPSATGPSIVATVTVGSGPVGIGVNPTTNRIYVANSASSNVSVIDAANNTVITTVAVGGYPLGIGVNPTTNRVYVSLRVSDTVSVIDGANNSVVATVAAGAWPVDVGINPITNRIYVANQGTNDVLVIDGSNNEVSATVTVGSAPGGIAVNPTINHIYVANYNGDNVSVIDGINNTVVATVTVGEDPMGIGVNPTTNRIYVANNTSNTVSVIDGTNNAVVATVTVGSGPVGISVNPTTNRIYVANSTSNTVSVIDGTNNAVVATVTVGSSPFSRGDNVNPATGRVYVANHGSNNVSVIQDAVTMTWYVAPPPLGNDTNDCISPAAPCATVQHAIDVAYDGDQVFIASGLYTESDTLAKAVSLIGADRDTTILHAVEGQRVLTITGAAIGNAVVISGLTFTGGDATDGQGTSIFPPPTIAGPKATPTATPTPTSSSRHASHLTPVPHQESIHASIAGRSIPVSWQTRQSLQDFDPARDGVGGGILITNSARPELQSIRVISNISGYGGGLYIYNNNSLTLSQVDVFSNVAVYGGGLLAYSPITVLEAHLSNNYAVGLGGGAQISGTAVVLNSSIDHNEGGGLYVEGNLTLQHTDVSFNTDRVFIGGSGITLFRGRLILDDATVEGNHGEYWGSGIFVDSSTVWITNTRVLRNSAYQGGGLRFYNGSSGRVVNSLFAQNSSSHGGASIQTWGDLQVIHTTIADTGLNPSPAVFFDIGSLFITDTLITSHTIGIERSPYATGVHEDYNLFFANPTDRVGVTPGIHSLNGDPLFVDPAHDDYHLRFGSAAIDHGVDAGVYTDLDGNPRPHGAGFDIGAYEYQGNTRYVATTGVDISNVCLDSAAPCATVQHAIDVANDDDQVLIATGVYTDVSMRPRNDITTTGVVTQMVYLSKTVTIQGGYTITNWITPDPLANPTVLDAQNQGRVFYITGDISPTIEGLRLTQGNAQAAMDGSICTTWWECETVGSAVYARNAAITLNDSQIDNNYFGRFDGGSIHVSYGQAVLAHNTVMSNFNSGIVLEGSTGVISGNIILSNTTNGNGGGVLVKYGTATLVNNLIVSNTADYVCGGGVCIAYGNATLDSNVIRGNSILSGRGGGIDVFISTATLTNNLIEANHAGISPYIDGGGVGVEFNSDAELVNNVIRGNTAASAEARGGGVYVAADSHATFVSNTVQLNTAATGGGVYLEGSNNTLTDNLLAENHATGNGGGIYAANAVTLTNVDFISNTSQTGGGMYGSNITVFGGRFEHNTAHTGGGLATTVLFLSGTQFISNTASYQAGGAGSSSATIIDPGSVMITSTEFLSNTAASSVGGGLYADGNITAANTRFEGNRSLSAAGGGLYTYHNVILSDTRFINNSAGSDGGGALVILDATVINGYFERNASRGGYYLGGGGLGAGSMSLSNTQFLSNTAAYYGGGASTNLATIMGGRFQGNYSGYDGGGAAIGKVQFISNTVFAGNAAAQDGGGLSAGQADSIANIVFARNSAGRNGAALRLNTGDQAHILHTTITSPTIVTTSAVSLGGVNNGAASIVDTIITNHAIGISTTNGTVYEDYNLFFGNLTNTVGATSGGHSLIGDPKFVDPLQDDYHLQAGSAAIDHGIDAGVTTDLDANPRPIGAGFDIGAYEYQVAPSTYTLTLATAGNGAGTVSANPPGPSYLQDTVVTLTATPLISSTFIGFSGDVVTTTPQITLTMDADKSITTTFALKIFVITPTASANGSITPSTPQTVNYGASQTFTITPNAGYHIFDVGVNGISQGAISLYTFTSVIANHTITASFALNPPNTFTLTVNTAGNGSGSVALNPPGPTYTAGTIVTLTATPLITSTFAGWSGDIVTTSNPITVTMTSNKTVTAMFALKQYTIYLPLVVR
jgi:YVTN family beta-propeller protein/predicted outer membrane repeat protein